MSAVDRRLSLGYSRPGWAVAAVLSAPTLSPGSARPARATPGEDARDVWPPTRTTGPASRAPSTSTAR